MDRLTPVPIVWRFAGENIYVVCDFDDFAHHELTGDREKAAILWLPAGIHAYRYLVDGSYMCDPEKPQVRLDNVWYNQITVEGIPDALRGLRSLTLSEMEGLDRELFPPSARESPLPTLSPVDSDEPSPVPQSSPPPRFAVMQLLEEQLAAGTIRAGILRWKVYFRQFLRTRKACVVLQKYARRFLCQIRFKPLKEAMQELKGRNACQKPVSKSVQTDLTLLITGEVLASYSRLQNEHKRLADENAFLAKELSRHRDRTRSANVSFDIASKKSRGSAKNL